MTYTDKQIQVFTGVLALGVMLWFGRELARLQARAAKRTMI